MTSPISIGQASLNTRPHALYRFYDASDVLLYVGITVDMTARLKRHRAEKSWWLEVSNVAIENFDSRAEALDAEREAIKAEKPLYNIEHNLMLSAGDGKACPAGCNEWSQGRNEFAHSVIDYLGEVPGTDRFNEAVRRVKEDMAEPDEDDRIFSGDNEFQSTAIALVVLESDELRSFKACAHTLLKNMPESAQLELRKRVLRDFDFAGEGVPSDDQALPHMVRHAGRLIAELMGEA